MVPRMLRWSRLPGFGIASAAVILVAIATDGCAPPDAGPLAPTDRISVFNGIDLTGWVGDTTGYAVEDGLLVSLEGTQGNLYLDERLSDFAFSFEFRLTPGANNGVGIRAARDRDAAFHGMEIQIIDDYADEFAALAPWQYHGSVYGVQAARTGFLRPAGEWNSETIRAVGRRVTVTLNDTMIVDVDLSAFESGPTPDGREHPGLLNESGYVGFLGHGDRIELRELYLTRVAPGGD